MSAHDIMPDSRQNDHHNGHKVTTQELKQPQIRMPKKKSILQEGISDNISVMIQVYLILDSFELTSIGSSKLRSIFDADFLDSLINQT